MRSTGQSICCRGSRTTTTPRPARLLAGQTELRRDRVRRAEQWLIAAIRLDPRLVQAHRELIFIYSTQLRRIELDAEFLALSQLTDLTFDNAFHWCLLRTMSWEPSKMIGPLARFLDADPDDLWSRLAIAGNYRRMGRSEDAERTLADLTRSEPAVIDLLARIALDRQDTEQAERLLATAPSDDPLLARLRGRILLAKGDAKSALDLFRIAFVADPLNRETLFGLTAALKLSGDPKAAEPYHQATANLDRLNSLVQRRRPRGETRYRPHATAWSGMRGPPAHGRGPRLVQTGDQLEPARFRVAASVVPADRSQGGPA